MINKLLILLLLFVSSASLAQNVQISVSGKVQDQAEQSIFGATVNLINPANASIIQTVITNEKGFYLFKDLKKSNYKISFSLVGYQRSTQSFSVDTTSVVLPTVMLQSSQIQLGEVTIVSRKPPFEQKFDRMVVNVDAMISAAGSSVFEVLEKSPGVLIAQNGGINLKGKGVTIFIDGKPSYLSGSDLENYLRSLSASNIDQIELMTNPPAKYDAAGNGGVINIRTKKTKITGINGAANLSFTKGKYARTNNGFNLNYRNQKINISGIINYISINSYSDLDINRHFSNDLGEPTSNFLQNSYNRSTGGSTTSRINLDYYVTDKTTFGIGFSGAYRKSKQITAVQSNFQTPQQQLTSSIIADNLEKNTFKNGAVNLNFRHEFDKNGTELTADADYLNYNTGASQNFVNNTYLPNGTISNAEILTGNLPTGINIYSFKTDYSQPLKNGVKLAAGLKSNITFTDNDAKYFNRINDVFVPDFDKTNHFKYREQINAAYVNADKEFNRFSVQLGLRFEHTLSKGQQLGNEQKEAAAFNKKFGGLFPTAYVQYKLDSAGNNLISMNYGRRIDRPYYQDLNPFLSPIDKFTYYTGNPYLKPSYTNNLELSHSYKNMLTTTLSYGKTLDQVNETIEILDGVYYSRPGNIGQAIIKSISVNGNIDPFKWLNINLYSEVTNIHTKSDFYTGYLNTKGTFFYLKPVFQFKAKNDWILQLDGYFQSKVTNAQFITGNQKRINTAVAKKLSPASTIKLVLNDIFHSYVNSGLINNLQNTKADYRNITDTRNAVISFNYRFGKAISGQRKHNADGAKSEAGRVKN